MICRKAVTMLAAVLLAGMLTGCNVFDWTDEDSTQSLINEGRQLMREGSYAAAEAKFAEAMLEEPQNADARYYHAKAVIHGCGFNPLVLVDLLENQQSGSNSPLPFFGPDWPAERADGLFQAARIAYVDLSPIYYGRAKGEIGREDIEVDLAVVSAIRVLLLLRDTDLDGRITDQDFWFDFAEVDRSNHTGLSITNLPQFIASRDAQPQRDIPPLAQADPVPEVLVNVLNEFIDNIAEVVSEAYAFIVAVATQSFGVDVDEIEQVLQEVILTAHFYRIEPGVDNDGDGLFDEEIINGLDDDGDGLYDEDANGTYEVVI